MKRDTDQTTKQFPATPVEVEDAIRRRAYESYEQRGRADGFELDDWAQAEVKYWVPGKCQKQHNSYPQNRRGWAIVRSSALLLTAQAATSREDASSEQSLALMIDWEFDTTAAAEGLLAKLRDLWARPWQDCYAEPRGLDPRKNQGLSDTRIAGP